MDWEHEAESIGVRAPRDAEETAGSQGGGVLPGAFFFFWKEKSQQYGRKTFLACVKIILEGLLRQIPSREDSVHWNHEILKNMQRRRQDGFFIVALGG